MSTTHSQSTSTLSTQPTQSDSSSSKPSTLATSSPGIQMAKTEQTSDSRSPFFRLPGELRNMIYNYCLPDWNGINKPITRVTQEYWDDVYEYDRLPRPTRHTVPKFTTPAVLLVNRQMSFEVSGLYRNQPLVLDATTLSKLWAYSDYYFVSPTSPKTNITDFISRGTLRKVRHIKLVVRNDVLGDYDGFLLSPDELEDRFEDWGYDAQTLLGGDTGQDHSIETLEVEIVPACEEADVGNHRYHLALHVLIGLWKPVIKGNVRTKPGLYGVGKIILNDENLAREHQSLINDLQEPKTSRLNGCTPSNLNIFVRDGEVAARCTMPNHGCGRI